MLVGRNLHDTLAIDHNTSPAETKMTTPSAHRRLTGWLEALERLRPVPTGHCDEQISRAQALLLLRCGEDVLNELCDRGLPHKGAPPEEHYDGSDLMNLAYMSKSNRSLPELGASFVSRIAHATPRDWVSLHRWILQTYALTAHRAGHGDDPSWSFLRPTPERFGGSCLEWEEGGVLPLPKTTAALDGVASSTISLTGRVLTRGEVRVVRSSVLRELYREVLETIEFFVLPASLETDVETIVSLKRADCVGVSVLLEHECRRAGYRATARRGYLLGLLGMGDHCWLEVLDDDGRIKILDPSLPMVARTSSRPTPAFTAFCLGSISNRLLPFDCRVDEQIVEYRCNGTAIPSHAIIAVEPDVETESRQTGQ